MKLYFYGDMQEVQAGLALVKEDMGILEASREEADFWVRASKTEGDVLEVSFDPNREEKVINLSYSRRVTFFRALSLCLQQLSKSSAEAFAIQEKMYFTLNGPMYDVSQGNAVINLASVKRLLRTMAQMGLNMFMLYCEDSYVVEGEPYFGYMRGKYTQADMKAIDDYADALGIEVIPCIQTLAHMANTLRWNGVYGDLAEDDECLLVGEEKVYEFIRRMIESASAPLRSRRIHIGMDEAWQLGLGKYLRLHGYTEKTAIMHEHLQRVIKIVRELGLEPMMWADMFFRAETPDGSYYVDPSFAFPPSSKEAVPADMELVYWDYYHDTKEDYLHHIDKHCFLASDPSKVIFAGGIWTWLGFGADWPVTFRNSYPAVMACKEKGIREVLITVWGDCGTECNVFATLPGLCFYAEHGYRKDPSMEEIARRFDFVTGDCWDDFMRFADINYIPGTDRESGKTYSASKFLMYQDVLEGLFDANFDGEKTAAFYESLTKAFERAAAKNGPYADLMRFYYYICHALALKADLGIRLRDAYLHQNRQGLRSLAEEVIPEAMNRIRLLRRFHRDLWQKTYRLFGWDILDMRYGSVLARCDTAIYRILCYLGGDDNALSELDEPRLPYNGKEGVPVYTNRFEQISSPSTTAR
ncbi:MAG: beta-N-acetylhexosaminidase [Firmicutes bacterium]|nr:beta-N-acetylhexosaminidase [Bacillota bacterium]